MKFISNAFTLFIIIALAVMGLHGKPEQPASTDLSEDDLCLVRNVYHEARSEDVLGQAAVAHVTLNRVRSPAYPDRCAAWSGRTGNSAGQKTDRAIA